MPKYTFSEEVSAWFDRMLQSVRSFFSAIFSPIFNFFASKADVKTSQPVSTQPIQPEKSLSPRVEIAEKINGVAKKYSHELFALRDEPALKRKVDDLNRYVHPPFPLGESMLYANVAVEPGELSSLKRLIDELLREIEAICRQHQEKHQAPQLDQKKSLLTSQANPVLGKSSEELETNESTVPDESTKLSVKK